MTKETMTLEEIQAELSNMCNCADPQYAAAFDYVQQITTQSLLQFINGHEYLYLLQDLHVQVKDAPESDLKTKLNTCIEGLIHLVSEEIKKAEESNKETSVA